METYLSLTLAKSMVGRRAVQLDGLRALAVAAVAWSHWSSKQPPGIALGRLGVTLFFVLSG